MTLLSKISRFNADADLAHEVVHGDENTVVNTDGGPVRSLAKLVKDKDDEFVAGNVVQQALAAQTNAQSASNIADSHRQAAHNDAQRAESARDAAQAAQSDVTTKATAVSSQLSLASGHAAAASAQASASSSSAAAANSALLALGQALSQGVGAFSVDPDGNLIGSYNEPTVTDMTVNADGNLVITY